MDYSVDKEHCFIQKIDKLIHLSILEAQRRCFFVLLGSQGVCFSLLFLWQSNLSLCHNSVLNLHYHKILFIKDKSVIFSPYIVNSQCIYFIKHFVHFSFCAGNFVCYLLMILFHMKIIKTVINIFYNHAVFTNCISFAKLESGWGSFLTDCCYSLLNCKMSSNYF